MTARRISLIVAPDHCLEAHNGILLKQIQETEEQLETVSVLTASNPQSNLNLTFIRIASYTVNAMH